MEHTIFKTYGMLSNEEIESMEAHAREFLEDINPDEEYTDEDIEQKVYEDVDTFYEDEILNLNKRLDGRILAIASMGLWDGRKTGYKILGNNLNEVVSCGIGCDEKHVYCDQYNVIAEGYHHDGRNYVEFREIREDKDIDKLLDKIYNQEPVSRAEIRRYTKSLRPYIKKLYGI